MSGGSQDQGKVKIVATEAVRSAAKAEVKDIVHADEVVRWKVK